MIRYGKGLVVVTIVALALWVVVLAGCAAPTPQTTPETTTQTTTMMPEVGQQNEGSTSQTQPPDLAPTETVPSVGTTSTETSVPVVTQKEMKMKQRVKVGDWWVNVKSRSFMTATGGVKAPSGMKLLVLSIWLKNGGKVARPVSSADFRLTDTSDNDMTMASVKSQAFLKKTKRTLRPGKVMTFKIAYEVPKADKQFKLMVGPFSSATTSTPVIIRVK